MSISEEFCTQKGLADILGITQQRVSQLVKKGVLSFAPGTNKLRLGESVRAYADYKVATGWSDPAAAERYNEAKAAHEVVKRKLSELKLGVQRGELVQAEDVLADWVSRATTFRSVMLSLPGRLCAAMAAEDRAEACAALLDNAIQQALEELEKPAVRMDAVEDEASTQN